MMEVATIIQPAPAGGARQLFLLFPDAGQPSESLAAMAGRLAEAFPAAAALVVQGPLSVGKGRRWLTVPALAEDQTSAQGGGGQSVEAGAAGLVGLEEGVLARAVDAALPGFIRCVRHWQNEMQVSPAATALLGQGEGGTMALAAALSPGEPPVCARVTAVGGRYALVTAPVPTQVLVHLLHGKQDQAVHFSHALRTAEQLVRADADITADVVPHENHVLGTELQDWVMKRLQTQVPRHVWEAAMRQAQAQGGQEEP
ncbi:MAG: prolyl oligopeptidase family serine peptidase [Lautropia sp.]|nr:prolyl oligopeptidase family serine peptidase [Lautropia sp.]